MAPQWDAATAASLVRPQEVQLRTRRHDGSLRTPRIIWDVLDGDRIFIRSTNGRGADWFRWLLATMSGQIIADGQIYEVTFTEAKDEDLAAVDAAYRAKYGHYASIVDHLNSDGPGRQPSRSTRPDLLESLTGQRV